jgi:hypothetical protein
MPIMTDLLTTYLACWNETDADARRALIDQHWNESATYVDPLAQASGREELSHTIGAVHAQFPGFVFTPVGDVDAHHNQARFQWGFGPADAEPVVIGFDVITTDTEGRIERVFGFLDRVPS